MSSNSDQLSSKIISCWTFDQLDSLTETALRKRAHSMLEKASSEINCPPIPHDKEGVMQWILELQCYITGLSMKDFLVPDGMLRRPRSTPPHPITAQFEEAFGRIPNSSQVRCKRCVRGNICSHFISESLTM